FEGEHLQQLARYFLGLRRGLRQRQVRGGRVRRRIERPRLREVRQEGGRLGEAIQGYGGGRGALRPGGRGGGIALGQAAQLPVGAARFGQQGLVARRAGRRTVQVALDELQGGQQQALGVLVQRQLAGGESFDGLFELAGDVAQPGQADH